MSNANSTGAKHSDVAPILRVVFPNMSENDLAVLDEELTGILMMLYEDWVRNPNATPKSEEL